MKIELGDKIEIIEEIKCLLMKGKDKKLYIFAVGKWFKEITPSKVKEQ